ncbi:MAG: hypothetical protein KBD37_01750 [Burkholderiales bacterium]|nr:hypothetical protein [Burkholderiales bacterium]
MKISRNRVRSYILMITSMLFIISCGGGNNSSTSSNMINGSAMVNGSESLFNKPLNSNDSGNQWAFMSGYKLVDQYGVYGNQGVVGGLPGTRTWSIAQTDSSGKMWLFGGNGYASSGAQGLLNDLWSYDTNSQVWTWVSGMNVTNSSGVYDGGSSDYPGARYAMVSWMDGNDKLWVFGGNGYDKKGQRGYLNDLWQYDNKSKLWTWIGGSKTISQAGVYGSLGQADAKNIPGSREGAVSWLGIDGKLWLFGGYGLVTNSSGVIVQGVLNDLWQYDPNSKLWTWVSGSTTINAHGNYGSKGIAAATNIPGGRFNATSWVDKTGNLWLFGGNGYITSGNEGLLNDLWKYDISIKQWIWVGGTNLLNQSSIYGIQGVSSSNNIPGGRAYTMSLMESSGIVLLFGGSGFATNGQAGYLNDIWQYDSINNQWAWIGGSTNVNQSGVDNTQGSFSSTNLPGGRSTIGWVDKKNNHLWLFGGYGFDINGDIGVTGDLWQYIPPTDTSSDGGTWTWISGSNTYNQYGKYGTKYAPSPDNIPGSRNNGISVMDKTNNRLLLFGGYGYGSSSQGLLSDLWQYDLSTKEWTWIWGSNGVNSTVSYGTKGSPGGNPGARHRMGGWIDKFGRLWILGGDTYDASTASTSNDRNDLWQYDPSSGMWTWMSGSNYTYQVGTYGTKGVPSTKNTPGAKRWSVSWMDKDDNLWSFGGEGEYSTTYGCWNDLWRYNYNTNEWTWISGASTMSQSGIYGTKGVPGENNVPGARREAVGWIDSSNNLWLFGGLSSSYNTTSMFGDLWRYNIATNQWTWMSGSQSIGTQYGSYGNLGIPDAANLPGMRYGAISWTDNSNNLWLFGGYGCAPSYTCGYLNDLWKYDITNGLWTWMGGADTINQYGIYGGLGIANANNTPGGRDYSIAWVDNSGDFWLFGGYGYPSYNVVGYLNDLWKYVPPAS